MADGGDVKGVWHIFEAGLEYVSSTILMVTS